MHTRESALHYALMLFRQSTFLVQISTKPLKKKKRARVIILYGIRALELEHLSTFDLRRRCDCQQTSVLKQEVQHFAWLYIYICGLHLVSA